MILSASMTAQVKAGQGAIIMRACDAWCLSDDPALHRKAKKANAECNNTAHLSSSMLFQTGIAMVPGSAECCSPFGLREGWRRWKDASAVSRGEIHIDIN